MSTTIAARRMVSDRTPHTARWTWHLERFGQGGWIVSWLPGRLLTRNQAVTAMTLAEEVAGETPAWPNVAIWAAELDLTCQAALTRLAVA